MNKLTPLPGYALIRLEGHFQDTGSIIIPEKYKSKRGYIGVIEAIKHKDDRKHDLKQGHRVAVMALGGTPLPGTDLHRFPIEHVLAILPDAAAVSTIESDNPRCRFCGDAKGSGQNVMLTPGPKGRLYCPRCSMDQYGIKVDPFEMPPMSDELEAALSG